MGVRKGQYFIIGTILIAGLLLGILSVSNTITTSFASDDITRSLFENSLDEFPRAVEGAARDEATSENIEQEMRSYIGFQQHIGLQYGIDLQTQFLIGLPTDSGINVTFGNFRNTAINDTWIRVGGNAVNPDDVDPGTITTYRFPVEDRTMEVEFNTTGIDRTFRTSRRVFSLVNVEAGADDTVWRETRID